MNLGCHKLDKAYNDHNHESGYELPECHRLPETEDSSVYSAGMKRGGGLVACVGGGVSVCI